MHWLAAIPGPGARWVSSTGQVTGQKHRCACGGTWRMQFLKSSFISQILFSGPHDPLCLVWILPITLFHLSKFESLFSSF